MRVLVLALALGLSQPLFAQDLEQKKPAAKKPASAGTKKAHQKPSKDQIRKFNDLEKKQK